jgi:hypothetical protein
MPSTLRRVSGLFEPGRSEPGQTDVGRDAGIRTGDTEEIDALPVLADDPTVVRAYRLPSAPATYWKSTTLAIPAVQAAAVAAGGFVAGAAVVGLAHRRHRQSSAVSTSRRVGRGLRRGSPRGSSRAGELVQIVGSRSFLVDVHLLGGRD